MNVLRVSKAKTHASDVIDKILLYASRFTSINRRKVKSVNNFPSALESLDTNIDLLMSDSTLQRSASCYEISEEALDYWSRVAEGRSKFNTKLILFGKFDPKVPIDSQYLPTLVAMLQPEVTVVENGSLFKMNIGTIEVLLSRITGESKPAVFYSESRFGEHRDVPLIYGKVENHHPPARIGMQRVLVATTDEYFNVA